MKRNFWSAFMALSVFVFLGCSASSRKDVVDYEPGMVAPATRVQMIDGSMELLDEYRSKKVALLFWATDCTMSKSAIKELNEKAREYSYRDDLEFIAISIDEDRDMLEGRIARDNLSSVRHGFSGNGVYDESYLRYGLDQIPTFFLLNEKGVILARDNEVDLSVLTER
ncbi:MAG: thioredoxin family protein [Bdellovibrionales bacterium]|nr:thioredoxin family protein [Bdellovibrionales bacterium]